ncbi:MAG: transglutaminase family protein, partial [Gammaproteobacteria bacterium]|nr:transglutaminase family protein [Gammaproteobacteria bacterium]
RSLCDKFGLLPLEFDGVNDSIYHPFDKSGQRHMEYVRQRGVFNDLPLDAIVATFKTLYQTPDPKAALVQAEDGVDWLSDVEQETRLKP